MTGRVWVCRMVDVCVSAENGRNPRPEERGDRGGVRAWPGCATFRVARAVHTRAT